jgi:hypothetical protein
MVASLLIGYPSWMPGVRGFEGGGRFFKYFKIIYLTLIFFNIFWAKYFGNLKNGQKKCPKIEIPEIVLQKIHFCDHN